MIRYEVHMTELAADDLKSIADYISGELMEPDLALKQVKRIKSVVMGLSEMPAKYPLVADSGLASQGIRKSIVNNYIIFYTISENDKTVNILRILYQRRNWIEFL